MKIKSIKIINMHNVENKTYQFEDVNYISGSNGAGKSTILEAIQLAVLGYIPGYPKRYQDIMKHASNKMMSVKVIFDDGNYIERTYLNQKSKISSDVDTSLENVDSIASEIEIPIYNFNSFLSLSPNEQKKWFLGYLPKPSSKFIWKDVFDEKCKTMTEYDSEYINSIVDDINSYDLKSVSDVHEYIKSLISLSKSQIRSKQAVLSDLMYYEDVGEYDLEQIEKILNDRHSLISEYGRRIAILTKIENQRHMIESHYSKPEYDSFEEDPEAIRIKSEIDKVDAKIKDISNKIDPISENVSEIETRLTEAKTKLLSCMKPDSIGDSCPYLPEVECDKLANHKLAIATAYKSAKSQFDKVNQEYEEEFNNLKKLSEERHGLYLKKDKLNSDYDIQKQSFESYFVAMKDLNDFISNLDFELKDGETANSIQEQLEQLQDEINDLTDLKSKLLANKKYNEISEENVKDLNIEENHLAILEVLRDYTGPNELQSELAELPFVNLSSEITKYLKKMFNDESVECWFNLSSKSNSFEFGIKRNDRNVPFTVLSSGEKCMYMLALQSTLLSSNDSEINVIMIDDAFDHLDESNIESLVKAIMDVGIQYIIAGVAIIPNKEYFNDLNRIRI